MGILDFFSKKKPPSVLVPLHKENNAYPLKASANSSETVKNYNRGSGKITTAADSNYLHSSELIFSCIDYISKAGSQAQPKIGKIGKDGKIAPLKNKDPLNTWISSPNPYFTWGEIIELLIQSVLLSGTSFLSFENNKGRLESWFLGGPVEISIVPDVKNYIGGFIWKDKINYKANEVCVFRNPTINNLYYGVPTVKPLLDTLNLEAYAITDLINFYKNSSLLTGILKSEYSLSPEQIATIREQFNSLYAQNGTNRGGTAVLPNGLSYVPIQANPSDSKILESLQVSEKRVLRLFKLNPIVLGGEAIASSPQELMKSTYNTAVRPYLYRLQDSITLFLRNRMKDDTLVFYFDFDRVVELDTSLTAKSDAAKTCYSTGLASLNEARDMVGLSPVAGANADKNILPAYLVGSNASYIQDGANFNSSLQNNQGNNLSGGAGSTNPNGGIPDTPTAN